MDAERRSLRVTVVGINYSPEPTGIAPYTTGLAEGLADRGHRVRVITGYPHYPWWKVAQGYTGLSTDEVVKGVEVRRKRHYVPSQPSTVRRAFMEVGFGLRAVLGRWSRPDVVLLVSPALISSRLAQLRALATGVPVVTWVQDIYTLGLVQAGGDARQRHLVRRVESSLLARSTRVVVIHERFKSWMVSQLGLQAPVDVVRNWSHVQLTTNRHNSEIRSLHDWAPEDVVALHAGNMGAKQGLETVVAASRLAAEAVSSVRFVLLGDGNQRPQLEALDPNPRLQFIDPLPDGLFEDTLAAADILLVNELPGLTEMSVPSKLTTYYATGLPIVASVDPESVTAAEVKLAGAGLVVPAGDSAALLREVEQLAAQHDLAATLGAAGLSFRLAHLSEAAAIDSFEQSLTAAVEGY